MGRLPRHQKASPAMANAHLRPPAAISMRRNREDRLSTLHDDILLNILDRLNVRDAARTSILSRRWSQLSAKLSRLIINSLDFLPEGVSDDTMSGDDLVRVNAAVVEVTKSMLTRRNPGEHTIRLLSTTFHLRDDAPISIGHAIGNAMATHKIEKIEFKILTQKEEDIFDVLLSYGAQFVSLLNECRHAFTGLTCLHLDNLMFAESDFMSTILGTCKQLECLVFSNCDIESWVTVQVEHAQLSDLSFIGCRFGQVELKWLPSLTRINFEWLMRFKELPLSFGHVPLLEVVSLTNIALKWHKMVKLSMLLFETSVRDLYLNFKCEKIWVQPEYLTKRLSYVLHRLSIVNLDSIPEGYDLTWTMFILEAAPSLKEFYMTVTDHPCEMEMNEKKRKKGLYSKKKGVKWESPTSNFKHYRLNKLIIVCFESDMVSHVRRVMEAAVNLKNVYLYNRVVCMDCVHLEPVKPSTFPWSIKKRRSMRKLITQGIESHARIHFLGCGEMSDDHAARIFRKSV